MDIFLFLQQVLLASCFLFVLVSAVTRTLARVRLAMLKLKADLTLLYALSRLGLGIIFFFFFYYHYYYYLLVLQFKLFSPLAGDEIS